MSCRAGIASPSPGALTVSPAVEMIRHKSRAAGYRLASRECHSREAGRTIGDKGGKRMRSVKLLFAAALAAAALAAPGDRQGLQDRLLGLLGNQSVPRDDGQRRQEGRRGVEGQGRQCRPDRHQWRRHRQGQAGLRPRGPLRAGRRRRADLPRRQRHGRRADQEYLQRREHSGRHHRHRRPLRQIHQPDHHRQSTRAASRPADYMATPRSQGQQGHHARPRADQRQRPDPPEGLRGPRQGTRPGGASRAAGRRR